VVFINLPLPMHARARDAATAALAAQRQGKFWEMHDMLFDRRRELGSADFSAFAEELGLDVAQFEQDLQDPAIAKQLEEDEAVARTFGIRSTPSSFVNGRFVRGAQGTDVYQSLIDEERGKAKALVDAGTPRQDVYERLLANALTEVAGG
jgi:protein-disulfide isomerase